MASQLRVDEIIASTGSSVAIGTAGGSVTLAGDFTVDTSKGLNVGTGATIFSPSSNVLTLGTNNAERVRIDASGRIGINGTPNATLDVQSSSAEIRLTSTGQYKTSLINGASGLQISQTGAKNIIFETNANERLRITSSGNVGIGTDNPQAPFGGRALHLGNISDTRSVLTLQSSTTGRNSVYFSDGVTGGDTYRGYIDYIHSDNAMTFGVETSERARITSGGNVEIANGNLVFSTSGTGIDFSADGNAAGMTSELLDDYEEGTWTPSVTFGGGSTGLTYSVYNRGWYAKIGRVVVVKLALEVSNKGTSTGSAVIGLPFSSSLTQSSHSQVVGTNKINSTTTIAYGTASPGFNLYKVTASTTGGFIAVTDADCGTSFSVIASLTYMV